MKNIEEFINQQLLKDSKEIGFINSLILETIKNKSEDSEYANAGNAAEYLALILFYDKFESKFFNQDIKINTSMPVARADFLAKELTKYSANIENTYEKVYDDVKEFVDNYFNSLYFRKEFLEKENLKTVFIKHTGQELSGRSSGDIEIIFVYSSNIEGRSDQRKNLRISLKRGNKKIYGASKIQKKISYAKQFPPDDPKHEIEKNINLSTDQAELENSVSDLISKKKDAIKFKGGGPLKYFEIFDFKPSSLDADKIREIVKDGKRLARIIDIAPEIFEQYNNPNLSDEKKKRINQEKTNMIKEYNSLMQKRRKIVIELYDSFRKFFHNKFFVKSQESTSDEKFDSTTNPQEVIKLFSTFINLITRADSSVVSFVDLKSPNSVFNIPIVNKYIGHIQRIHVNESFEKNPVIIFSLRNEDILKFEKSSPKDKTFNSEMYKKLYKLGELSNALNIKAAKPNIRKATIENLNTVLKIFNIKNKKILLNEKKELENLYNTIIDSSNSILESLSGNIFKISYEFKAKQTLEEKIKQKAEGKTSSDDSVFSSAGKSFFKFAKLMNSLYELQEGNSEVAKFLDLLGYILKDASSPEQISQQESIQHLFETLILEKLNEKEYSKVMKKVSSCDAKGLISAVPSNKTANTIAVRFDADESIDSGIKKIKSSLRSSGYDLEDKRVLKFDQDRDTTDVLKNGEVVARLFYRADIKERKGLAYEHIIGAVLTKKITSQLKNRIDLPPDASKDQVMEKLRSEEFGKLFQSAKKAAPLIIQKVGNIVSAESVGSTNNKADFVLKTDQGKTIGLSAKYATGEKDNEYKMNKVLGFGTEEDSLVYNPKGVPWWIVGRKTFLKKLKNQTSAYSGREYNPDPEDLDAPAWMKAAKESKPEIYKETMEEVYAAIRNILTSNLKKLGLKGLIAFANEADLGKEEERQNYDIFLKVVDGPSGLSVTEISLDGIQTDGIDQNIDINQIVVQDRSDIIIKIPGHDELKINSVKFKSDMLSSKAGDLKIKTR